MSTSPRPRPASRAPKPVAFEPLVPQPAYGRVAAAIEKKILDRSLRPGDPLPTETELATQFAVNRSTVREALRRLESAGLVGRDSGAKRLKVTRPGHADTASRVSRALTLDEVTFIELWEAMRAVAPRTAALAAANCSPEALAALEDDIATVESARGSEAAVAGVVDFFGRLALASGNRVLMLAMQPVTRLLAPSLRRMIDRVPQGRSRIVVAQRCIVEALRSGDAAEAESWMTRHVQDFRRGYEIAGIALDTRVA
ncbi:MAG: GntR family transcriptional regulator [Steroidobacteraceae bacterium]|nr:GntR family transcriptional regulator [Steroidobacteraceae bacterium]